MSRFHRGQNYSSPSPSPPPRGHFHDPGGRMAEFPTRSSHHYEALDRFDGPQANPFVPRPTSPPAFEQSRFGSMRSRLGGDFRETPQPMINYSPPPDLRFQLQSRSQSPEFSRNFNPQSSTYMGSEFQGRMRSNSPDFQSRSRSPMPSRWPDLDRGRRDNIHSEMMRSRSPPDLENRNFLRGSSPFETDNRLSFPPRDLRSNSPSRFMNRQRNSSGEQFRAQNRFSFSSRLPERSRSRSRSPQGSTIFDDRGRSPLREPIHLGGKGSLSMEPSFLPPSTSHQDWDQHFNSLSRDYDKRGSRSPNYDTRGSPFSSDHLDRLHERSSRTPPRRRSRDYRNLPSSTKDDPRSPKTSSNVPIAIQAQIVRVREYINNSSGILEMPKQPDNTFPSVFFHSECVYITNRSGNPYGLPIKSSKLQTVMDSAPMGMDLMFSGFRVDNLFINYVATSVWPRAAEPPQEQGISEERIGEYLKEFTDYFQKQTPVAATFHGIHSPKLQPATAAVWEIFDFENGILETKVLPQGERFFALFHREDVYLKDGKRAVEHEFFANKPLKDIVHIGQLCNFSARSISTSKGFYLKPSMMELQAVVVSLNPETLPHTAPRATRLKLGPGAYGVTKDFTPCFFQQGLKNSLNKRLLSFLNCRKKSYTDLDPACLTVDPEELPPKARNISSPVNNRSHLKSTLVGVEAQVLKILYGDSGILEGRTGSREWSCFFTSDQAFLAPGKDMSDELRPGTKVLLNATLLDESETLQYAANLVWFDQDYPGQDMSYKNKEIGPIMRRKFKECNELVKLDKGIIAPSSAPDSRPHDFTDEWLDYFNLEVGTVFRILDSNFALIRVRKNLILFDVCDFWTSPDSTAVNEHKSMEEVTQVGAKIEFHASLLDKEARIQYLASSAWPANSKEFTESTKPRSIVKSEIIPEKVKIYEAVVKSVSKSLPSKEDMTPMNEKDIMIKKYGIVRQVFFSRNKLEGGIIEFDLKKFAFFPSECVQAFKNGPAPGVKVYFNSARLRDWDSVLAKKISFMTLSVYETGEFEEDLVQAKFRLKTGIAKFKSIVKALAPDTSFLEDPSHPRQPVISLAKPLRPKSTSMEPPTPVLKNRVRFKCLFENEMSGILVDVDQQDREIYFEMDDVNIENQSELQGLELISLLNNLTGIEVICHSTRVKFEHSTGMRYATMDKGIQILGNLPRSAANARRFQVQDADMKSIDLNPEKMKRFLNAEKKLINGEVLSWSDITRREREKFQKRVETLVEQQLPENLDKHCGTVYSILNDNFGLIKVQRGFGKDEPVFCLFDTCDLHLSERETAADKELSVSKVLSVGDKVAYNACLIDKDHVVPYLATSVWKPRAIKDLETLPKSSIQQEKLDIYKQVVESCGSMLMQKEKPEQGISRATEKISDDYTTGTLVEEKGEQFGIIQLNSGKKALVEKHRVWLHDKPKYGNWKPLYSRYFKTLNVNARSVQGFQDFDFQVTFAHAGYFTRYPQSRKFNYSDKLRDWIKKTDIPKNLDEELQLYAKLYPNH